MDTKLYLLISKKIKKEMEIYQMNDCNKFKESICFVENFLMQK